MDEIGVANARLRALAVEAKAILIEAIKAERSLTPVEQARLDTLLREKARIESQSP